MCDSLPKGLTTEEARALQARYGKNCLIPEKKERFITKALHILAEPMFLLLIAAAVIYFLLGEPRDGAIMLILVLGTIGMDVAQEWKTDRTLNALKDLSAPHIRVLRDGAETTIASADLVPGDLMFLQEGVKIPADGTLVRCSDLCVDESSLTGEAEGVWKRTEDDESGHWRKNRCYAGTLVMQGTAAVVVDTIGAQTEYGKIGTGVAEAPDRPTPLEKQTDKLVKTSAVIAAALFILVGIITWYNLADHEPRARLVESFLSGITLAMAMIPEEFPVILAVFLSMGAWRLARKHSLVRRLPAVETLGAVSVLCVDKTGTITLNRMTVREVWDRGDREALEETMGLACETEAYDPMEKAMLSYCAQNGISEGHLFGGEMISEYPFTNEQKMMGHVWRHDGEIVIAAKGSPERLLTLCALDAPARAEVEAQIRKMGEAGLRVIAVGTQKLKTEAEIPAELCGCTLTLLGLVGLADPPRENIREDILTCRRAGIRVVMITGDNGVTAGAIARAVGMEHSEEILTGDMLDAMSDEELCARVRDVSIFARVIPAHKMRIVQAFKANGEIVAMTGDGVNDAPALKYADIGVAMGKRGSEVSREAADLVLLDDNFSTIVDTIRDGRRIFDNIRKAVGYVFTIHIPIAFASLLAPMLGIAPDSLLLLPLHVVLLEMLIDPTCSIVLERQPAEPDVMDRPPRDARMQLLTPGLLTKSILQGLAVFAAFFGVYYVMLRRTGDAVLARSMGLCVIILCNLLLVQVNSSERDSLFHSARRLAKDKVMWLVNAGALALLALILYSPLHTVLKLSPLRGGQLLACAIVAAVAVLWYEIVKAVARGKGK